MSDIAIKVENLSKLYQLGQVGTGTISRDIERWWARVRGKEDPFAKIGQVNDRTKKAESDFVWALKDINFEVKKGEVLGIIGRNGAGKSTILKILSKITSPTTGKIHVNGRIASLLEVGTGFHPEMTGRENIYLNGSLLGMRKWEIQKKFEEIVDFAGVEAYIDTPVKRYSSGMYVRLAFAVAAFLEPEILIVDEVLAVGDAEFQKKCLGQMKYVSTNEGRTILFVSHNLGAIINLTSRCIFIDNGKISSLGPTDSIVDEYARSTYKHENSGLIESANRKGNGKIRFSSIVMRDYKGDIQNSFKSGESLTFELTVVNKIFPFVFKNVSVSIDISDCNGSVLQLYRSNFTNHYFDIKEESNKIICEITENCLAEGEYIISLFIGFGSKEIYDYIESAFSFSIIGGDFFGTGSKGLPSHCKLLTRANWFFTS